jgi:transglutaminase-like putative cysteine protease
MTHVGATAAAVWAMVAYSNQLVVVPEFTLAGFFMWVAIFKFMIRKTTRDYGLILVVAMLLIVVSARVSVTVVFPLALAIFLVLGTYVGILFHFRLESDRHAPGRGGFVAYPRHRGLGSSTLLLVSCSTIAAVVAFLFAPRVGAGALGHARGMRGSAITGFQDTVVFGGMRDRIQNNYALALRLKLRRGGTAYGGPEIQPYLRGQTLEIYQPDHGRWQWRHDSIGMARSLQKESDDRTFHLIESARNAASDNWIEQEITLVAPGQRQPLFATYPPVRVVSNDFESVRHEFHTHRLIARSRHGRTPSYTVYSQDRITPDLALELLGGRGNAEPRARSPRHVSSRVRDYADALLAEAGVDRTDRVAVADTFLNHLRSSKFAYTLERSDVNPDLEPIEDFLLSRQRGHCEYFASAMTVMCQLVGVPARLVTGYRGGDYNEVGRFYEVRENHAHSWVEVYIPEQDWVIYDPTPAWAGMNSVAPGWAAWLGSYVGYWQFTWANHVIGYDADQQESMLHRIRQWLSPATDAEPPETSTASRRFAWGQRIRQLIKWTVALALVVAVMVLVVRSRAVQLRLPWRLLRWLPRSAAAADAVDVPHPEATFYDDFVRIARRLGLRRAPDQTPREFAVQVARQTGGRLAVREIADALYLVEYGRGRLDPARQDAIRNVLAELRVFRSGRESET